MFICLEPLFTQAELYMCYIVLPHVAVFCQVFDVDVFVSMGLMLSTPQVSQLV